MTFEQQMKDNKDIIEALLPLYLGQAKGMEDRVYEAMAYSLMAGGKRLRPMILMEVLKLMGGSIAHGEAFIAAIEMIHTYSLIHDDLPAMDDDELRRGLPTCHVKFGEDMAILAGDGLLNRAFEIMTESSIVNELGNRGLKAMACLGEKAGTRGMIGGQVVDILSERKDVDMDAVMYIHLHKTSALIEAAFMMGGYLSGADEPAIEQLRELGRCVGLAFQIQDDILDIESTEEKLGKPINSDERNAKMTYVGLKGMEESRQDIKDYLDRADRLVSKLSMGDGDFLRNLITYIRNRDY